MKFANIKIGAQFEHQNERYEKINSLMARHLSTGKQKLFKRSSVVQSFSENNKASPASETDTNRHTLQAAIEHYHQQSLTVLQHLNLEENVLKQAIEEMNTVKNNTYQSLNIKAHKD